MKTNSKMQFGSIRAQIHVSSSSITNNTLKMILIRGIDTYTRWQTPGQFKLNLEAQESCQIMLSPDGRFDDGVAMSYYRTQTVVSHYWIFLLFCLNKLDLIDLWYFMME
ncbi:hypothetical protein ACHQM5_007482 [Ranunculus cassubicifolius]